MGKAAGLEGSHAHRISDWRRSKSLVLGLLGLSAAYYYWSTWTADQYPDVLPGWDEEYLPYGTFPQPDDPFRFLPCTSATKPPPLDDPDHQVTWAALFDRNPDHWNWGNTYALHHNGSATPKNRNDPYPKKGIYLCGYLDVPLDYTNSSDPRIARLAVTKYQVSGLAPISVNATKDVRRGRKSTKTLIVQPGGPGGSGTSFVWRGGENQTERFSSGKLDVLGWDPRGVNISLPSAACFPYDADRDRWSMITSQNRASVAGSPRAQLNIADAMNNATFAACKKTLGDLPRFLGTALVARDLEQIRMALDEPGVTGYFVSYGTGIGQTYANMYPQHVGNLILDGTEYVRDHRRLGGFGWTALDNGTDAWNDGFLGECIDAGPKYCALAEHTNSTLDHLKARMSTLLESIKINPLPAFTDSSGPSLVTYSALVEAIYGAMYSPFTWPSLAKGLSDLEQGNTTLISRMLETLEWEFDPTLPCRAQTSTKPSSVELTALVICVDSYDAPEPQIKDPLTWWSSLWQNMTSQSWIAGDSRFYDVLPCRHYTENFGDAVGVYRGDLNHTLSHPVLLIAEIYDPATPLRNGRRLAAEMGSNARLIVHHGYGHSSRDTSKCTEELARDYILHGTLPENSETACYADEKPYRYGAAKSGGMTAQSEHEEDLLQTWRHEMHELSALHPRLRS